MSLIIRATMLEIDGAYLKRERWRRMIKAKDFAKRLGISPGYLSDLESGKKNTCSMELVHKIETLLEKTKNEE